MLLYKFSWGEFMETIEKIESVIDQNGSLSSEFGIYSKCYLHTTENIKNFLEFCSIEGKDVLTVAGSGDQLLNAYALGAKRVDVFDINILTQYTLDFKISAVLALDYDEFISFFFTSKGILLDPKTFSKVYTYLNEDTKEFFTRLINKYGNEKATSFIYYSIYPSFYKMRNMNVYLDEENYYKLKEILKHKTYNFIRTDILNLKDKLDKKYDVIMFSNISDSIDKIFNTHGDESLKKYKRLIHEYVKYLKSYGIIEAGYVYENYCKHGNQSSFSYKNQRQKIFTTDEFYSLYVPGYDLYSSKDSIIYYAKKK